MSYATYSFQSPQPRDGTGNTTPSGSAIPKMRGRKRLSLLAEIKRLEQALESLSEPPCALWACKGPQAPLPMTTCCKCWAMRDIAATKTTLERQVSK